MTTFQITGGYSDLLHIEDRLTKVEAPGRGDQDSAAAAYAAWFTGYGEEYREQHVTPYGSLTYSAVWRCVQWISQTIASLGWGVFEKQGRDRVQIEPVDDNVAWNLGVQANPEVDAFNWRQTTVADALIMGNGYSELEFDGFGRFRNSWRISSDRVCPDRTNSGDLIYEVENGSGVKNTILFPDEIFHLRGPSSDGIVGYAVLELARKTIQLGLSQESFGLSFFKRGPMPGGVLEIPGSMNKQARDEQRESFERVYGGRKNVGRVIVLTGGNKFTPLTLPNKDAEFIASREFGLEEVCRWFGVPPHKIADLRRSTNNNIEHQSIEAVQDCLLPWCRRLESEADVKLFGRVQRGKRYTRLNLASLLRGDTVSQTASVVQKVNAGLMTPNEGREYFDMNPTSDGDALLVQGAMKTLDQVLNPPEPPAPVQPPTPPNEPSPAKKGQPPTPPKQPTDAVATTYRTLLCSAYGRLLRVEADKAIRAAKQGQLEKWSENFYNSHYKLVVKEVKPILEALILSLRAGHDAGKIAETLAGLHVGESIRELRASGATGVESWETVRAEVQAGEHLNRFWNIVSANGRGLKP